MQVRDVNGTQLAVISPVSGGFARHSHDEYVISVNLSGRERVRLDRSSFEVDLDEVTIYNPGQIQSCTTRTPEGTAFTCVSWYVPPTTLSAFVGGPAPDFQRPVVRAAGLRLDFLRAARELLGGRLGLAADPEARRFEALDPGTGRSDVAGRSGEGDESTTSSRPGTASGVPVAAGRPGAVSGGPVVAGRPRPGAVGDLGVLEERLTIVLLRLLDLAATSTTAFTSASGPASSPVPASGTASVAAVLDRLRGDLTSAPRLADLAAEAGMSREHLVRSFTRATGCPPYAWHLQARLAEGRRRLRRGVAVAEVAHGLGFADQAHFHRHFLAAYGITPGRFRGINI